MIQVTLMLLVNLSEFKTWLFGVSIAVLSVLSKAHFEIYFDRCVKHASWLHNNMVLQQVFKLSNWTFDVQVTCCLCFIFKNKLNNAFTLWRWKVCWNRQLEECFWLLRNICLLNHVHLNHSLQSFLADSVWWTSCVLVCQQFWNLSKCKMAHQWIFRHFE